MGSGTDTETTRSAAREETGAGGGSRGARILCAAVVAGTVLGIVAVSFVGCAPVALEWPDEVLSGAWSTYHNDSLGYSLRYPAACSVDEDDGGRVVRFRYHGAPIIVVTFASEREAARRGLWPDHLPVGEATLGGRAGEKYVYNHYDGPFGVHTVSYVVPHEGRQLGMEFRTDDDDPSPVQRQILGSFRFADLLARNGP